MQSMPVLYDIVVVGAGLIGAAVAHRLAKDGHSVLVLEAGEDVGGLSVRGCGLALLGTAEPYASLVERRGMDDAHCIWALTQENLALLKASADALNVPVHRVGSFRATGSSAEAALWERSYQMLEQEDFAVELDDATEAGLLIGLRTEADLAFEPSALITALLEHPNITLRTGVEVQTLKDDERYVDIWAHKHYVRAGRAVLAAGPYLVHLDDAFQTLISLAPMQVVHSKVSDELAQPWIFDTGDVLLCDLSEQWRTVAWSRDTDEEPWDKLVRVNEQFCPDARIVGHYTGWIACSADSLPILGGVPGYASVYSVGGLGAWGASWAFVAAEQMSKILDGEAPSALLRLERFSAESQA
jgi:glycine/D-amino acid oxidase-like deaminating enzyme